MKLCDWIRSALRTSRCILVMHVHIWSITNGESHATDGKTVCAHAAGINDWTTGDADGWRYDVNGLPEPAVSFRIEVKTWLLIPALCT